MSSSSFPSWYRKSSSVRFAHFFFSLPLAIFQLPFICSLFIWNKLTIAGVCGDWGETRKSIIPWNHCRKNLLRVKNIKPAAHPASPKSSVRAGEKIFFREARLRRPGEHVSMAAITPTGCFEPIDLRYLSVRSRRWRVLQCGPIHNKQKQSGTAATIEANHADRITSPAKQPATLKLETGKTPGQVVVCRG